MECLSRGEHTHSGLDFPPIYITSYFSLSPSIIYLPLMQGTYVSSGIAMYQCWCYEGLKRMYLGKGRVGF